MVIPKGLLQRLLEYWSVGVMEKWGTGVLEYWKQQNLRSGIMVQFTDYNY